MILHLQGRQESNPQPTVLETVALPIELHPFIPLLLGGKGRSREGTGPRQTAVVIDPYFVISVT